MYMSFYYGSIVFLIACIFYDLFQSTVTGFTFGYVFAFILYDRSDTFCTKVNGGDGP